MELLFGVCFILYYANATCAGPFGVDLSLISTLPDYPDYRSLEHTQRADLVMLLNQC